MISIYNGEENGFYSCMICNIKDNKAKIHKLQINRNSGDNIISFGICNECLKKMNNEFNEVEA